MIARRVWRSRITSAETAWPRGRFLPSLSFHWRRRRAAPRSIAQVVRTTETRVVSPVTALSVHQHLHRRPRIVSVQLPASLQAVARITERLVRDRWLGARPLDAAAGSLMARRPETAAGPAPRAAKPSRAPESPPQMAQPRRPQRATARVAEASQPQRQLTARIPAVRRTGPTEASPGESPVARRGQARQMDEPAHDVPMIASRRQMTTAPLQTHGTRRAAAPLDVTLGSERRGPREMAAVPMDWRTPPQTAAPERARPGASTAVPADAPAASSWSPGATSSAHGPGEARGTLAAAVLDASVVDRLADTVMQRIERRVRIERERRGL